MPPKGYKYSDEERERIYRSRKGQVPWNKGKKASDEARKNMSEAHKGVKLSEETKCKMS